MGEATWWRLPIVGTIRFSRGGLERERLGMDLKSLEIPSIGFAIARLLKKWRISRIVGRLGIGRVVAKILSSGLMTSGALFLITVNRRDPDGYMEAGRAAEHFWLEATDLGLSVHPYGVIPQYLTMADISPEIFQPKHLAVVEGYRDTFKALFGEPQGGTPDGTRNGSSGSFPAIMFRVGYAEKASPHNDIRLQPHQIIRD